MTEVAAGQGEKLAGGDAGAGDAGAAAAATAATAAAAAAAKGAGGDAAKGGDAAAGGGPVLGGTGKDAAGAAADVKVVAPADWPENWRDKFAEQTKPGDKDFRARLDRFASPADVGKSFLALEQRLKGGELKAVVPFPEKGTDEQKAAWRKEQGVPDAPDGYKPELKNGMVIGEADKPVVEAFAKAVHGKNWTQAQFNDALQTYYEIQDGQTQQVAALDATRRQETEDGLRAEFGTDYRRNTTVADNFLGALPEGIGALLANGRLADGTRVGDDPRFIKAIVGLALEMNPTAALLPPGSPPGMTVDGRLAEIRKFRQENPNGYDSDQKMQAEELHLLEAQSRTRARGKAA